MEEGEAAGSGCRVDGGGSTFSTLVPARCPVGWAGFCSYGSGQSLSGF